RAGRPRASPRPPGEPVSLAPAPFPPLPGRSAPPRGPARAGWWRGPGRRAAPGHRESARRTPRPRRDGPGAGWPRGSPAEWEPWWYSPGAGGAGGVVASWSGISVGKRAWRSPGVGPTDTGAAARSAGAVSATPGALPQRLGGTTSFTVPKG